MSQVTDTMHAGGYQHEGSDFKPLVPFPPPPGSPSRPGLPRPLPTKAPMRPHKDAGKDAEDLLDEEESHVPGPTDSTDRSEALKKAKENAKHDANNRAEHIQRYHAMGEAIEAEKRAMLAPKPDIFSPKPKSSSGKGLMAKMASDSPLRPETNAAYKDTFTFFKGHCDELPTAISGCYDGVGDSLKLSPKKVMDAFAACDLRMYNLEKHHQKEIDSFRERLFDTLSNNSEDVKDCVTDAFDSMFTTEAVYEAAVDKFDERYVALEEFDDLVAEASVKTFKKFKEKSDKADKGVIQKMQDEIKGLRNALDATLETWRHLCEAEAVHHTITLAAMEKRVKAMEARPGFGSFSPPILGAGTSSTDEMAKLLMELKGLKEIHAKCGKAKASDMELLQKRALEAEDQYQRQLVLNDKLSLENAALRTADPMAAENLDRFQEVVRVEEKKLRAQVSSLEKELRDLHNTLDEKRQKRSLAQRKAWVSRRQGKKSKESKDEDDREDKETQMPTGAGASAEGWQSHGRAMGIYSKDHTDSEDTDDSVTEEDEKPKKRPRKDD